MLWLSQKKKTKVGFLTDNLTVKCGIDYLKILELQPEGKTVLEANEFLNGYKSKELFFA